MDNEEQAQPKVFVSQYVRNLDFAEAEKFGEVIFLTSLEYRPEPVPNSFNDAIINDIKRGMTAYISGLDFIMTTGSGIPNIIVGGLLRAGEHKILKWSNQRKTYELFKVRI
ncbi:hypothetical protein KAR91_47975 [Candidatus Pacearchaeota archaeon]|nr:hypothetical protein [Candidatus Pacearchaeota archaeon]